MRIFDGEVYRDATVEEEALLTAQNEENKSPENALSEFFAGLASSDTNSIAKIRALAQKFIDATEQEA